MKPELGSIKAMFTLIKNICPLSALSGASIAAVAIVKEWTEGTPKHNDCQSKQDE